MKQASKVLALLLCLCMLIGFLPVTALKAFAVSYNATSDDYYKVISQKDWDLAPGITESEIVLNNDSGSHRQVTHVVEVDATNEYVKIMPSYTGMAESLDAKKYSTGVMSEQVKYAEANGYGNVVAAMNISLSWYDSDYYKEHPELKGEPLGYLVMDGKLYTNSQGQSVGAQTCVVINFDEKDGEARPADMPKVQIRATSEAITGWEEQVIPANFGFLVKDGKNLSGKDHNATNGASRSFVGVKADGTFVMVMNDGRQSPYSAGFTTYEMADFMISLGCVVAVNGDGGGSSTFLSQRPGEDMEVNCAPSDGAERPTTHGILVISSAPATGEFVRATITTENQYFTPGSTVKFSALGTDLVGTPADVPADVTWQIKEENMGTIENGVFVSNGTVGTVTAQLVYGGAVVGEHAIEIVIPEKFAFNQASMTVPFGKVVTIGLQATINGGLNEVVLQESDVTITLDNAALGTIHGFTFTSVDEASAPANLKGTLTATLECANLTATVPLALGKGSEVLFDFEEDISGWLADDVNYPGKINMGLSHANADNGQVHDGNGSLRFDINTLNSSNITMGGYTQAALYLQEGIVIKNAKSLGVWVYVPDEMFNLWIRMHYFYDSNGDGTYDKKNNVNLINQPTVYDQHDEDGWYYFSTDISGYESVLITGLDQTPLAASKNDPNNYRFIEIMLPHTNTNTLWKENGSLNGPHTIYFDNITVDYSEAVDDREAPVFGAVNLTTTNEAVHKMLKRNPVVINENLLNIVAAVSENTAKSNATGLNAASAKVYIDGVEVESTFANGKIFITDIAVADGMHRVKFEICDNAGNKSVVVRLVNVQSGVDASTVQVVPADPTLDRLYGGSIYWMNINATDIETIQSVKTVIDLNGINHWELEHMAVAEGFTAAYAINAETNTATITITRTGKNAQTGAATLAALPIRIIYFDTDIYNPDTMVDGGVVYNAETFWKNFEFWPQDLKVDVDFGQITYVEGYISNVLNTFSNEEFSVDTEMYSSSDKVDVAFKEERGTCHVHTPVALSDKAATCTEAGYTGRTYCEVCESVVEWGETIPATGHSYEVVEGVRICTRCDEKFNGEYDGKTYIDGIIADGWIDNTYYYVDGIKTIGSIYMNNVMYTFDDNGVYLPDYKYDGFFADGDKLMFFVNNSFVTGAQMLGKDAYYFDENGYGYEGEFVICGETCYFDDGKYVSCSTADLMDAGWCGDNVEYIVSADGTLKLGGYGMTYAYQNHGNRPFIDCLESIKKIEIGKDITLLRHNIFAFLVAAEVEFEEESKLENISTGAFHSMIFLKSINIPDSVTTIGAIAFKDCTALRKINLPANITSINSTAFRNCSSALKFYVEAGSIAEAFAKTNGFAYTYEDYVLNGFIEENGELYYYIGGVKHTQRGVFKVGENYYYAKNGGALVRNQKIWASVTNDLVPFDMYYFDENGVMEIKNGFVEEDGEVYYYVNGVKHTQRGVFKVGENYYYAKNGGALVRNQKIWASVTNDLVPLAMYYFDENGIMIR